MVDWKLCINRIEGHNCKLTHWRSPNPYDDVFSLWEERNSLFVCTRGWVGDMGKKKDNSFLHWLQSFQLQVNSFEHPLQQSGLIQWNSKIHHYEFHNFIFQTPSSSTKACLGSNSKLHHYLVHLPLIWLMWRVINSVMKTGKNEQNCGKNTFLQKISSWGGIYFMRIWRYPEKLEFKECQFRMFGDKRKVTEWWDGKGMRGIKTLRHFSL